MVFVGQSWATPLLEQLPHGTVLRVSQSMTDMHPCFCALTPSITFGLAGDSIGVGTRGNVNSPSAGGILEIAQRDVYRVITRNDSPEQFKVGLTPRGCFTRLADPSEALRESSISGLWKGTEGSVSTDRAAFFVALIGLRYEAESSRSVVDILDDGLYLLFWHEGE